jgi:hypothetical protein
LPGDLERATSESARLKEHPLRALLDLRKRRVGPPALDAQAG